MAPSNPTAGTPARLQITYSFEPGQGNDNRFYLDLEATAQRAVRSEMGLSVRQWFPIEVRDEWLALQIPTQAGGTYLSTEALTLMSFKVGDPRITRTDLALDAATVQAAYNVHDDVQCSSIKVDFVVTPALTPLVHSVTVDDPVLPGGSGTLEARFRLELKWEVPLSEVV